MGAIVRDFFLLNLKSYPEIGVDFYINVFLLIITVTGIVTLIVSEIMRRSLHSFARALALNGARDEETACTLSELGLEKSRLIRISLSHGGMSTRIAARVGEKKYTYEEYVKLSKQKGGVPKEKIDFSTARFYIREGALEQAKRVIETYNTPVYKIVLFSVLFIAVYVCMMFLMPEFLKLLNDALQKWHDLAS